MYSENELNELWTLFRGQPDEAQMLSDFGCISAEKAQELIDRWERERMPLKSIEELRERTDTMRTETAEKAAETRKRNKEAEAEWLYDIRAGAALCRQIRDDQQADVHARLRSVELLIQLSHERS